MTARYIVGDVLDVLRSLPDASVDLVLSSPPFLALRSYLPAGHPLKAKEIGSEATPGAFIDALLVVTEECRRVLAPHGSLAFELGDTFSGSGGAGGDYNDGGWREAQERFTGSAKQARVPDKDGMPPHRHRSKSYGFGGDGWPEEKSLCLIPESYRWALAYGRNPFTGRETPRWRVRNVVRWCRPNPPVGALADKVRPATSDIVIACTARDRYFDLDAIRGPGSANTHARTARGIDARPNTGKAADDANRGGNYSTLDVLHDTNGAPPLDHWWHDDVFDQDAWLISTEPFRGSHYATWPSDLCVKPIEAMCPRRVCTVCGQPSRRITERPEALNSGTVRSRQPGHERANLSTFVPDAATVVTTGWSDCGHGSWRVGVVLDPFAGSGTTLAVATGHGRDAIGIDLDSRNADLAQQRVGMFLTVESSDRAEGATAKPPTALDLPVGAPPEEVPA